jgi:hypothetical protein
MSSSTCNYFDIVTFRDGSLVCDEKRSYLWAICAYNNEFQD